MESVFGWIATGPANNREANQSLRLSHCIRVSIDNELTRFWEINKFSRKQLHLKIKYVKTYIRPR